MSADPEVHEEQNAPSQDIDMLEETPIKTSYKSFKKKYRKIMVTFEGKMKESNNMFREEQRMLDISRRLAEQNDQLLELLYDLNNCPELPPRFRYDLEVDGTAQSVDEQSTLEYDVPTAHAALSEARSELRAGEITPVEYRRLETSILRSRAFAPANSYKALQSIPHTLDGNIEDSQGIDVNSGFLSPRHEEQYVQEIDAFLTGEATTKRPNSYATISKSGDRTTDRDRDTALRNPVSVYNWLRKHQPQVFLQDKENDNEKAAAKASNSRGTKRGSLPIKQEPEMYDEDGIALEPKTTSRGKRKRDDDSGYRPKGGSSRSNKRRREDGGSRRNSKKMETPG